MVGIPQVRKKSSSAAWTAAAGAVAWGWRGAEGSSDLVPRVRSSEVAGGVLSSSFTDMRTGKDVPPVLIFLLACTVLFLLLLTVLTFYTIWFVFFRRNSTAQEAHRSRDLRDKTQNAGVQAEIVVPDTVLGVTFVETIPLIIFLYCIGKPCAKDPKTLLCLLRKRQNRRVIRGSGQRKGLAPAYLRC